MDRQPRADHRATCTSPNVSGGGRRPNDSRRLLVAADGAGVPIEAEGEPDAVRAVVTGAAECGVQGSGVRKAVADGRAQRPVSAENG
ncbi:hypothetical protein G3I43_30300, partial [Streptomyces anulatus]